MSEKMLKFVNLGQQTPPKRKLLREKRILTRFIKNLLQIEQRSNQVDVRNAVSLFAKYIVL